MPLVNVPSSIGVIAQSDDIICVKTGLRFGKSLVETRDLVDYAFCGKQEALTKVTPTRALNCDR